MLYAHYGNTSEILARLLAELVRIPPADRSVLQSDVIVVQNAGMARWLKLQVAEINGIAANFSVRFPAELVWHVLEQVLPNVPQENSFEPRRLAWRLFSLFDDVSERKGFEPLANYLAGSDQFKQWALAKRVAGLFDQYLVFRPEMILGWEKGDGDHWQAFLWRALVKKLGNTHWARLHRDLITTVTRHGLKGKNIPSRISVFGIPTLSPSYLHTLHALSSHIDVHLFWFNPCEAYWADITTSSEHRTNGGEELFYNPGNTLLAKWGKQGRDTLDLILELSPRETEFFKEPVADTLLASIQRDILLLQERGEENADICMPEADDRSLAIHVCHSPMREVEVLHDQLLARFQHDPNLEPGDVLVMTPDIDLYAPCFEAVFATAAEDCFIPYAIADQDYREDEPVVASFLSLLDLPDGRLEAESVLGLLEIHHIASRFGLDEKDLEQVRIWLTHTRVHWGRDAAGRKALGFAETSEHTWQAALDRLVLGTAMGVEEAVGNVLPYTDIEGDAARMLGRFHSFATTLFDAVEKLSRKQPVTKWRAILQHMLSAFYSEDDTSTAALQSIREAVNSLVVVASAGEKPVALPVIRSFLEEQFSSSPGGRARFLSGAVTCCAMVPMRSVPFKLICVLGMGDTAFPRVSTPESMDLMSERYKKGDRSRRDDDRYLFLETLLSARDALYISYVGRDIRDDSEIPPSVLISDLLDYIVQGLPGKKASDHDPKETLLARLITVHPLQAFDPLYFQQNSRYPGYCAEKLHASRALAGAGRAAPPFFAEPLADPEDTLREISLEQLVEFYCNPARYLLRRRLGLWLESNDRSLEAREPFTLDWDASEEVRREWFERFEQQRDLDGLEQHLRRQGLLPHGLAGRVCLEREVSFFNTMVPVLRQALSNPVQDPLAIDMEIDGIRLVGWLTGLRKDPGLVHVRLRRAQARDRMVYVLQHLALSALDHRPKICTSEFLATDRHDLLQPVDRETAHGLLSRYIKYFKEGQHGPLPFFPKSAWAYIDAGQRADPMRQARNAWHSTDYSPHGEDSNPYYKKVFADIDPIDDRFEALVRELLWPMKEYMEPVL